MNRELKFRAWNKEEKRMYLSPDEINHLGSWFDAHLPGSLADAKNITIMQYTGLKDKNGKEIYEGDWIKSGYVSKVVYDEKQGCFLSIYSHPEDPEDLLLSDLGTIEVIGNIYETP